MMSISIQDTQLHSPIPLSEDFHCFIKNFSNKINDSEFLTPVSSLLSEKNLFPTLLRSTSFMRQRRILKFSIHDRYHGLLGLQSSKQRSNFQTQAWIPLFSITFLQCFTKLSVYIQKVLLLFLLGFIRILAIFSKSYSHAIRTHRQISHSSRCLLVVVRGQMKNKAFIPNEIHVINLYQY